MTNAQILKVEYFPYQEFDESGNLVYLEDGSGYWIKWEYDEAGNRVYQEFCDDRWTKFQYDDSGNVVYCEDADGVTWRKEP